MDGSLCSGPFVYGKGTKAARILSDAWGKRLPERKYGYE